MEKHTWWKEGVAYQIYPRSFQDTSGNGIGDLKGIISRLDYLVELNIDIIWLSPIYDSPQDDNGYDISNYFEIFREFGTMADFDLLLKECHKRDIKLIMDLVVNHTSDEHPWFVESRKSKDNKYRNYYIWKDNENKVPNNWRSCFSGSAWKYDKQTDSYYLHFFSQKQCDLNWNNKALRSEIYQMMNFWGEKGIDGFRMDVITLIGKETYKDSLDIGPDGFGNGLSLCCNTRSAHKYLQEMHNEVNKKFDWLMVGEAIGATLEDAIEYEKPTNNELDMIFHFEHVDMGNVNPGVKWDKLPLDLVKFKKIFNSWIKGLDNIGWNSLYLSNHDQPRSVSRFGCDNDKWRERSAKMLALILHLMKGTPFIYQGEELGMTNNKNFKDLSQYRDLDSLHSYNKLKEMGYSNERIIELLQKMSRDNARTPMQWNSFVNAGFCSQDVIPWIEINPNYKQINAKQQVEDCDSVFSFYKKLIKLRHELDIIVYGSFSMLEINSKSIFTYERELNNTSIFVVGNFFDFKLNYTIPSKYTKDNCEILIENINHIEGFLQPYEAFAIIKK